MAHPESNASRNPMEKVWENTYNPDAYLDEEELGKEVKRLNIRLTSVRGILGDTSMVMSQALYGQWLHRYQKSVDSADMVDSYRDFFVQRSEEPVTTAELLYMYAHYAGDKMVFDETLTDLDKFATRNIMPESVHGFVTVNRFARAAELNIKIGDAAVVDFLIVKTNRTLIPALYFLLMESSRIRTDIAHQSVLLSNQDWIARDFPNLTMERLEATTHMVDGLIATPAEAIDSGINTDALIKESKRKTLALRRGIYFVMSDVYRFFMNPDLDQAEVVRRIADSFLDRNDEIGPAAIVRGGVTDMARVKELYRKALIWSEDNQYGDFYKKVIRQLERIVEHTSRLYPIVLIDDDRNLFLDEQKIGKPLSTNIGRTPSFNMGAEFSLDTDQIDWGSIIPPNTVVVKFKAVPSKEFIITLGFENELGEEKTLILDFNSSDSMFDWNFISPTDQPKMLSMWQAAMHIGSVVISQISKQVQDPESQTQYTPKDKEAKFPKPDVATPIMLTLAEATEVKSGVTSHINFPENEQELAALVVDLGTVDGQRAIAKIREFNEGGVGYFKPLNTKGVKNRVFELKVGDDIRVILTPAENGQEGIKSYNIIGIWYWKDAFKGANRRRIREIS